MIGFKTASLTAAVLCFSVPACASTINGDYTFTIVQQTRALGQNANYGGSLVLSDGSVVTTVSLPTTVSFPGSDRIEVVSPGGTKRTIDLGVYQVSGAQSALSANDKGQIVVAATQDSGISTVRKLLLIEPDNSIKEIVSSPFLQTGPDPSLHSFTDLEINENGEIAVSGGARLASGSPVTRIIKISESSSVTPQIQILDETDASLNRFPAIDVAIDDSGTAMWNRRNGDAEEVVLSDGVTEQVALFSDSSVDSTRMQYNASALTNSGLLSVSAVRGTGAERAVGTSDVTDGNTDEDFVEKFPIRSQPDGLDANEFGQVIANGAFLISPSSTSQQAIVLDGEVIIQGESVIDGITFSVNGNGSITTNNGQMINDAGQFAFNALGFDTEGGGQRLTIRADPIGATPNHAILPQSVVDGVSKVSFELVNSLGVDASSPIYVDPIFGEGLSYSIYNGGPNFTSIVVPMQDLGGLSMFDVVFGDFTQTIGFGDTLDFTTFVLGGVSSFEIFGFGGATSYTGDFVAGFTFATQGSVAMDIAPTSRTMAPVPLPAAGWFLMAALAGLFSLNRFSTRT